MKNETRLQEQMGRVADEVKALRPHVHPPVPNPAPLGLIGFGLTTALLQMKHTRIAGEDSDDLEGTDALVLGFAVFFGGLLQLIAGLSEIKRNNIFGYTAFCLYGGFWMSMGTVEIVSLISREEVGVNKKAVQCMLILVGIYTTVLWICTLKMNKTISLLFFLLASTLYILAVGARHELTDQVGGWFGFATAATAYWLAAAELINDIVGEGEEIIPLGQWSWNTDKENIGVFHVPGKIYGALHHRSSIKNLTKSGNKDVGSSKATAVAPSPAEGDIEEGYVGPV
mmetsp:Transcript_9919/g.15275  ORF Transcript_9919/g.15275 Transcript_9919/m.15275 type:complete len:284 (+) Transcript_9919:108-959(+)